MPQPLSTATTFVALENRVDSLEAAIASGVADGDKGDVVVSAGGTVWTLDRSVGGVSNIMAGTVSYLSLDGALTALGSNPGVIEFRSDIGVTAPKTIPANVKLAPLNGAKLVKSGTGAITFQGLGLENAEAEIPLFSGFAAGNITWTGTDYPKRVSTEIFDTANSSLNDRVARLDAALAGKRVTMICSPRTMDAAGTVIGQFHELEFLEGIFPNTKNVTTPVFYLSSNTRAHGSHNSWLYEPDEMGANVGIFGVNDLDAAYENIRVENLHFRGGLAAHGNAGSTVILGNVHRGGINNNVFWKTYGYNIIGGYGNTGNYAEDSDFIGNKLYGVGSQAIAVINAKGVWVLNNYCDQKDATGTATYTVIDFEPNTDLDKLEDIFCFGNTIDARDITPAAQVFAPSAVTVASDIINIPNHGMAQGKLLVLTTTGGLPAPLAINTVYYAIPVDTNNLKIASTASNAAQSIAINLTTQGTGNHTLDPLKRYVVGILAQPRSNTSGKNIHIAYNTIFSGDVRPEGTSDQMTVGIGMDGVLEGYCHNNSVRGGIQTPFSMSLNRYLKMHNNSVVQGSTVSGEPQTMNLRGNADSDFNDNILTKTSNPTGIQAAGIFESEEDYIVTTSGAIITRISGGPLFYEHFIGLKVTINNTDYTISTFTDKGVMTASASIGTLARPTFTSASVNAGTDEITLTAHGFITGAKLEFSTDGTLPAHTEPPFVIATGYRRYFAIVINANTIKIANSLANALAGTPIDLTNGGTGNHRLSPVLSTKFSNNKYRDNSTPDGIRLEPTGTSQIVSTADDDYVTEATDANLTVSKNAGIVVFPVLTAARTATLPDSTTLKGKTIIFKDGGGTGATFNIILDGNGSQTIDGAATLSITTNYGKVKIKSTGTGWITI